MYVCACTCTFEQLRERQKAFPESVGLNCLQLRTIQGFPRGLSGRLHLPLQDTQETQV